MVVHSPIRVETQSSRQAGPKHPEDHHSRHLFPAQRERQASQHSVHEPSGRGNSVTRNHGRYVRPSQQLLIRWPRQHQYYHSVDVLRALAYTPCTTRGACRVRWNPGSRLDTRSSSCPSPRARWRSAHSLYVLRVGGHQGDTSAVASRRHGAYDKARWRAQGYFTNFFDLTFGR